MPARRTAGRPVVPTDRLRRCLTDRHDQLARAPTSTPTPRRAPRSYKDFLRIPSISALPEHAPDVRRAAEWLADDAADGRPRARRGRGDRRPPGRLRATGSTPRARRRSLVYGHYDVQPVDPLDLWTLAALRARSSSTAGCSPAASADDKGQIHAHVMAAAALLATRGGFPINVKYVFEGEEESSIGAPRRLARGEPRPPRRRRRDHQRHGLLRGQHPGDHGQPARA